MLRKILALATLVNLARCGCESAIAKNGTTSAICTDESTGNQFELLLQDDKRFSIPDGQPATKEMLAAMYADYESGAGSANESLPQRAGNNLKADKLTEHFDRCFEGMEGVCANDHVIDWTGTPAGFQDALHFLFYQTKGVRMTKGPASICQTFKNKPKYSGMICLQWVYGFKGWQTDIQMAHMVNGAWGCQVMKNSAEIKLLMNPSDEYEVVQYFCVSNRSKGCRANCAIRDCPNIRPGAACSSYGYQYYDYPDP